MYRVGLGQDSHTFIDDEEKKPLVLGGVRIENIEGLKANSDGDVILHSICNALSSAIGGDSLSVWSDEMCEKGIKDSKYYVEYIHNKIKKLKYSVSNISISVEAKKPFLKMDVIKKIKLSIASLLDIKIDYVGLTFTSGENITAFGCGKGIQVLTIVGIARDD